jgi:RimJ/RimL family protein N-acetyltransferase
MEHLATESLLLDPLTEEDYPWVAALYSDAEVMRYIGTGPRSEKETRAKLDWFVDQARRLRFGYWVLRDRRTSECLGGAMLMIRRQGSPPEERASPATGGGRRPQHPVELGFALARNAWGRGIATEAARALVAHAFDALGVPEIEAFIHRDNEASAAVLRKAGLRDAGLTTGPYGGIDRRFTITAEEWRAALRR